MNYNNCAAYRIAAGELDAAQGAAREGLRWARKAQIALQTAVALQHLALIAVLHGQARRAASLTGYVDAQYRELEYEREPTEKWGYKKLMAALLQQLREAEIDELEAEGAAWSEDRAVEEALNI